MNWLKRLFGITELIKEQQETNKLLMKLIQLEKQNINNMCIAPSERSKAY